MKHVALRRALLGASLTTLIAGFGAGCAEELEQDPRHPVRVQPVFDPATSTIPLPNAAAVQADGTLPKIDAPKGSAQAAFYGWLDKLHGWLPETTIEVPFDGKLDASTVAPEDVILVQIAADGSLTPLEVAAVTYEDLPASEAPAVSRLVITPAAPLQPAHRYGVVVKTSINGENGEPILAPAAIFFGLNDGPLIDANGQVTVPQLRGSEATARQIEEGVRVHLAPIVDHLDTLGIDRKEIAAAFTWSTGIDTFTVLDPATATIPLPNTLALDAGADGLPTFPAAALDALTEYRQKREAGEMVAKNAQIYFEEYLDELHGWPNSVASLPIEVPLSGPVDPDTITEESVQLWYIDAEGEPQQITDLERVYVEEGGVYKIALKPASDLALDTDYFAFATRALKDPQGNAVLPPAAMALALQPSPLLDEAGNPTVAQLDAASAMAATGVQQVLQPFVQHIEDATGLEYDELASVWTWYTWRDPFVVFDPLNGDIPFPNAFLIGEDGTVELPIPANADPLTKSLFAELNTRDGFSVLGQGWVTVTGPLDPASVTLFEAGQEDEMRGAIGLAQVPGTLPEVLPPDVVSVEYVEDYGKIMFRMEKPLMQDTLHAAILSNRLVGVNGLPAKPTPIFVMLASTYPLYKEGEGSLVAQLPEEAAPALEEARKTYERLFLSAGLVTGDTRAEIVGAFAFTTDRVTDPLQQARARTMAKLEARPSLEIERACVVDATRDCATDLLDNTDGSQSMYSGPFSDGVTRDYSNLQQIQWAGEYSTVDFLGDGGNTFANWEGISEATRVGVSLFVPREVPGQCEPPFRVVIGQHGLTSSRMINGPGLANTFAEPETCLALVSLDSPLHGGRSKGSTTLHPMGYVQNSGEGFLTGNFVASKNYFMQGVIDLVVLNQLIHAGALEELVENTTANGTDPMFDVAVTGILGTSLGGIFSTDLTAIDPDINAAVLAVAPGKLTYYLTEPSAIGDNLLAPLAILGIEKGTFAFEQLISFVQWVADVIDPAAFAQHVREDALEVLSYDPTTDTYMVEANKVPRAEVLAQMAQDDPVAPNVSTRQLADILGISLEHTTFMGQHAFINTLDTTSPDYKAAVCARRQAAYFLRAAIDGDDTTLPQSLYADQCVSNL